MEARRRVQVTGVLNDGAELADGAQRAGVGAARTVHAEDRWVTRGGHL
jgi:hypothetical protein